MRHNGPTLVRDVKGAVMLVSLFLGLLLVGSLYYVLGVGDAVLYRRVMQDGADAGAFAASVISAKGMNLHALLNVVMAVTAGILLVIRSVEVLLEILLAVLHGLAASIVLAPKAIPLIAVLTPVETSVERIGARPSSPFLEPSRITASMGRISRRRQAPARSRQDTVTVLGRQSMP